MTTWLCQSCGTTYDVADGAPAPASCPNCGDHTDDAHGWTRSKVATVAADGEPIDPAAAEEAIGLTSPPPEEPTPAPSLEASALADVQRAVDYAHERLDLIAAMYHELAAKVASAIEGATMTNEQQPTEQQPLAQPDPAAAGGDQAPDAPPADAPPVEAPPAETPPADAPPAEAPSAEPPPADAPQP